MLAVVDAAFPYVHERKQFNKPVGTFQVNNGFMLILYKNDQHISTTSLVPQTLWSQGTYQLEIIRADAYNLQSISTLRPKSLGDETTTVSQLQLCQCTL